MNPFSKDIDIILSKINKDNLSINIMEELYRIKDRLIKMWERGLIKSNHSVMEFVISYFLLKNGYWVEVEYFLENSLICDIYAVKDNRSLIVEVETGFVPPTNAVDPVMYRYSREISKIVRYSQYCDEFALATPPYHILYIPNIFIRPRNMRSIDEALKLKEVLDKYYRKPSIEIDRILNAKINYVYIVYVDMVDVIVIDVNKYIANINQNFLEKIAGERRFPLS